MLTSDSGPPLRPKGLAKEEQRSLPTLARHSNWKAWPKHHFRTLTRVSDRGCTEPLLTALVRLAQSKPTRTNRPGTSAQ